MANLRIVVGLLAALCFSSCTAGILLKDSTGDVILVLVALGDRVEVVLSRDGQTKLTGTIGGGRNLSQISCIGESPCQINANNTDLIIAPIKDGFNLTWASDDIEDVFEDCYDLNANTTNWYGGPQRHYQVWPQEKTKIDGNQPYVVKNSDNFAVAERYWLNSNGAYIWLNDSNPLWVDQNNQYEDQICFKSQAKTPYINRWRVVLTYVLVAQDDPKIAHLDAVNTYLGKPTKHPNEKMITEPIWTTWAKYKKSIDDATVLAFANDIRNHSYQGGQLEIDDNWERCYGAQEFDNSTFSNIEETVSKLHEDGWRVTLWVHPFVNDDCQNNSLVGQESGYFVRNTTNQTSASWWDGANGHQIDFTNPQAAEWWSARLKKLQQSPGIDNFKFDAGESDYMNQPPVYADVENSPNVLTTTYIDTCAEFGDLIEFRSAFRNQKHGDFVRMLDKDSNWSWENGLPTLITTLLQLNMNGYGMVLPDMIGGNGYGQTPTGEMIIRWTQANTFMPSMQFSYLPWDFEDANITDVEGIVKKFVDLHQQYAPNILGAMNKSIEDGTPVNPPIWWIDPTDANALLKDDEYLLGEDILVAPIIFEGNVTRDVYLPRGQWKDGNNGTIYTGPITLSSYPVPIDILPYFILQ